ncbi:MAG: tyrosine--tRNA ligase [Desulfurococcales archaeon]|nr:tyrosine--tRNA ligase [Desulfurococcales archaeon]
MDVEDRVRLISRNTLEVVTVEELRRLLEAGRPRGYLGYEPSGLVHVGWLVWMFKVRDMVEAGVDFRLLEATWHAFINDKLHGDMRLIRSATRIVRAVLEAIGVGDRISYVDAEELASDKDYWGLVLRVLKANSMARMRRALTIMGRRADEAELDASKIVYPAMQVSDIFYMGIDIALGGMDQRKAHMLARDTAEKLGRRKPVAVHTPIISSLQGPGRMEAGVEADEALAEVKMSKSKPETAIFVHDPPEAVARKIRKAYCPARQVEHNPVLEINRYILFAQPGFVLHVERKPRFGGPVDYHSYEELERDFAEGRLHPLDLKNATAEALNRLLDPIRRRLLGDPETRRLIEEIERAGVTR